MQNHPFLDGNKRTGVVAALTFLDLNGVEIETPRGSLYDLTMSVAEGQAGKAEVAEFLRRRVRQPPGFAAADRGRFLIRSHD